MIRSPGQLSQFRHIPCRNSRCGTGREGVSGDTCRELLKTAAVGKVELPQAFQVSDTFGEWQVRQEQKIRVNLLGAIPSCNR